MIALIWTVVVNGTIIAVSSVLMVYWLRFVLSVVARPPVTPAGSRGAWKARQPEAGKEPSSFRSWLKLQDSVGFSSRSAALANAAAV